MSAPAVVLNTFNYPVSSVSVQKGSSTRQSKQMPCITHHRRDHAIQHRTRRVARQMVWRTVRRGIQVQSTVQSCETCCLLSVATCIVPLVAATQDHMPNRRLYSL